MNRLIPLLLLGLLPSVALAQSSLVIVDTGHTPLHPGATAASGRKEYFYNLDLSAAVATSLVKSGDRVARIAADGNEIELPQRATSTPGADFFISIHHDSMQQAWIDAGKRRDYAGYSIFVSKKNPHYEQSLKCAEAIGERLLKAGEKPSLYHATPIPGENRPLLDRRLGIHQYDDLIVLKTAPTPAVLVEAGVIANPDEEQRLAKPDTIARLADAIGGGVVACQASAP